jgi:hypothetical protein
MSIASREAKCLAGARYLAFAAVVGLTTSCGGGASASGRRPSPPVTSQATVRPLDERLVTVARPAVSHLSVGGGVFAFTEGPAHTQTSTPDELEVRSLDRPAQALLRAKSSFPGGQLDWVEAWGDWVVWTDMSRTPDDINPDSQWRMFAENWHSHKRLLLNSSGNRASGFVPFPRLSQTGVAWYEPSGNGARVTFLRWSNLRRRSIQAPFMPASTVDPTSDGELTTTRNDASGATVVATTLDSHRWHSVARTTHAALSRATGSRVVWQEPATGQPMSIWTCVLPQCTSTPALLGMSEGNAVGGENFVAWLDTNGGVSYSVGGSAAQSAGPDVSVPARLAASEDTLAWAQVVAVGTTAERSIVHLDTIR